MYQISPTIEDASISLGCSPVKTFFKITAVMMLPGVLAGAIMNWISVINELSASIILYTGSTKTLSVAIYAEVIKASYGITAAISSILTITTIISLLIFIKLTGSKSVSV
nr:ABC transporter permease subunit [Paenibacillus aceris]